MGEILELEGGGPQSVCTRTFPIHYAKDYLKGELQPKGGQMLILFPGVVSKIRRVDEN